MQTKCLPALLWKLPEDFHLRQPVSIMLKLYSLKLFE